MSKPEKPTLVKLYFFCIQADFFYPNSENFYSPAGPGVADIQKLWLGQHPQCIGYLSYLYNALVTICLSDEHINVMTQFWYPFGISPSNSNKEIQNIEVQAEYRMNKKATFMFGCSIFKIEEYFNFSYNQTFSTFSPQSIYFM